MTQNFSGLGVAMVTPFNEDKSIDFSALSKLLDHIVDNIDYLVVFGTTAESPVLTPEEKNEILAFVLKKVAKKISIIIGIGGNNTNALLKEIETQDFTGIDAVLSVTPYYNKPNQRGLVRHYNILADYCPKPIILYNVPSRTNVNIDAATTLELARHKNIIAIKEASGNFGQIMEILQNKPKSFTVISGDDALTMPLISMGVSGVISVIGNAFPKQFSEMVHAMLQRNIEKAKALHYQLLPMINSIFKDGNPAGIKALLSLMNITKNELRLPLVTVNSEVFEEIERLMKSL